MTDIWGNPTPHHVFVPVYADRPAPRDTPYPGLFLLLVAWTVIAFLYVVGMFRDFPRTGWHDAILAAAFCLSFVVGIGWSAVERIPFIGPFVYVVPILVLGIAPFALDAYLMFWR